MQPCLIEEATLSNENRSSFPMRPLPRIAAFLPFILLVVPVFGQSTIWPPEPMRKLPPDYLERLRACLVAGTERLGRLKIEDSQPEDSIGWVRYGQPSLLLGQRTGEINRFFESDTFVWNTNPKFGFSLFTVSFMRLYGLMNHRSGTLKGPLSAKAMENFERGMWRVAKANSKLAEAHRDVWDMEGSENHHLASKSCDLLAAQYLRQIPIYSKEKYDDGSTLEQQYETRLAYWLRWFDERAKRGQFVEAGSPSYQGDSINALFNVRDFAEDPVLRKKAEMYLDLAYAVMAEETLLTTRGGPKSRVKVGHEYDGGMAGDRGYNTLFDAPGREFVALGENARTTSDYFPPAAVVSLARDIRDRGSYSFTTRWPGPVAEGKGKRSGDPDGLLWRTLNPEHSIRRYGYATPDYVLGSAAMDPAWIDDASMGFRWQGLVFASDPLSRIGFEVEPSKTKDWHGFNPFFSLQDRNVMITQCWAPVPPNPSTAHPARLRVYFSPTLESVTEANGWIFVKDGGAYAAVKVVAGGYDWTPAWKAGETVTAENKAFITLKTEDSPVILVVNRASDYAGRFEAFQDAVSARPVHHEGGVTKFETLTFYGPAKLGEIGGKPLDLAPARGYDSPFVRSDWGSGLIRIRKGDETVILDFRDPQNPKRTTGVDPKSDPEFPPGVGNEKPIVFRPADR